MKGLRILTGIVAVLLLGTGCITAGTMQQANTVGKGKSQYAAEPGAWGVAVKGSGDNQPIPTAAFAARFGVTDDIDLGFRAGAAGFDFLTKFQLTPPTGVVISVAPSLGGMIVPFSTDSSTAALGWVNANLPVIIGIPVGRHQFILSPSIRDFLLFGGGGSGSGSGSGGAVAGNILSVGASVGFAIRFSDSFKMIPEVAVLIPALVSSGGSSIPFTSEAVGSTTIIYNVGVGFLWGNSR